MHVRHVCFPWTLTCILALICILAYLTFITTNLQMLESFESGTDSEASKFGLPTWNQPTPQARITDVQMGNMYRCRSQSDVRHNARECCPMGAKWKFPRRATSSTKHLPLIPIFSGFWASERTAIARTREGAVALDTFSTFLFMLSIMFTVWQLTIINYKFTDTKSNHFGTQNGFQGCFFCVQQKKHWHALDKAKNRGDDISRRAVAILQLFIIRFLFDSVRITHSNDILKVRNCPETDLLLAKWFPGKEWNFTELSQTVYVVYWVQIKKYLQPQIHVIWPFWFWCRLI